MAIYEKEVTQWLSERVQEPTLGKWCCNFEATKNYAETNGIPLIAMYTSQGCGNCNRIIYEWLSSSTFIDWMNNTEDTGGGNFLFSVKKGSKQHKDTDTKACYDFIKTSRMSNFPYFRAYWAQNGVYKAGRRYQSKPIRTEQGTALDTASEFISDLSSVLSGYSPTPPDVYYMITFDANGGTVAEAQRSVKEDDSVGELPVPSRNDYAFKGWFTAKDAGTKIDATTTVTADATYYAHWDRNSDPDPDIPTRTKLGTMFGLNRDCTIISKDNKILQYSAYSGKITVVGTYSPNANLAESKELS